MVYNYLFKFLITTASKITARILLREAQKHNLSGTKHKNTISGNTISGCNALRLRQ